MSAIEKATGILVRTTIFALAVLLLLFKADVAIDDTTTGLKWGDHVFAVPPGQHHVKVSFRYLFSNRMREANLTVEVVSGRTTTVIDRSPFLVCMGGSMKEVAP